MNHEELYKSLDRQILNFNYKAIGFLATIFMKPLATASDPFFRINMGERYFTHISHGLGTILWGVATWLTYLSEDKMASIAREFHFDSLASLLQEGAQIHVPFWTAVGMMVLFFIVGSFSVGANYYRQVKGVTWHSMSRGISIWGSEDKVRDTIILIFLSAALLIIAPAVGALFLISRLFSLLLIAQEQARIYARYLDAIDAAIESDLLEAALRDGAPPSINNGIYCPLPRRFKSPHRDKVARVAAGGVACR